MSVFQELVARNVKRFRLERGLSLSALAHRSGLAKQTISTIEQGEGNPTVETLGLISVALEMPVRWLLNEWGTPVFVQRREASEWVPGPGADVRYLDEVYGSGYVRTNVIRLTRTQSVPITAAHAPGSLNHLFVISGRVRTGPAGEPVDLRPGDFVRFPSDVPHRLEAISERAMVHAVTTEPQVRQMRG